MEIDDINTIAQDYASAWSSGDAKSVASFYTTDGQIAINRGEAVIGTHAIADMVKGFYGEFPDLMVRMDHLRIAGPHILFGWTLEGTHVETRKFVRVSGWEEWDLNDALKIVSSRGWFDAQEYDRQIVEGI